MKFLASIILTLSLASLAVAAPYVSYSVTDLTLNAKTPNTYTATASTMSNKLSKSGIPANGTLVTITTSACTHAPVVGETAIISNGPSGTSLIFSGGMSCKVVSVK